MAHASANGCHDHGHLDAPASGDSRRLTFALAIIVAFAVVEVIGGVLSGSLALLADAGHMATDALALALALWARHLATKRPTASYPFGRKRAQVLAAFVNGLALLVLAAFLLKESFDRLADPPEIGTGLMLTVAILGLVANLAAFAILHSGDRHDVNMRGAILHVIGDILGSVAAIVSAIVIATTGLLIADPIVTLVVCALIVRSAWALIRETAHVLLQGAPPGIDTAAMTQALRRLGPPIVDVHDLKIWMLTPDTAHLTMHVRINDPTAVDATLRALKDVLSADYAIDHSTIQVEYGPVDQAQSHEGGNRNPRCVDDDRPQPEDEGGEPVFGPASLGHVR